MARITEVSASDLAAYDRIYREAGLRAMAPPIVRYDEPSCPHVGCGRRLAWIAFNLESHEDPERVYEPLTRAWWEGRGFAGRCPSCGGWIGFTTRGMRKLTDGEADQLEQLPDDWAGRARIA